MEQGEKNWRVWSFGEDEKCQHVTLRAILLTCCQLWACTKGTTDGLYRKFEFQLIIKQEMKNTGYHTYTESPSENSDPYLLPRDKSGLWDRKGPLAFHKVLWPTVVLTWQLHDNGYGSTKCAVKPSLPRHPFEPLTIIIPHSESWYLAKN